MSQGHGPGGFLDDKKKEEKRLYRQSSLEMDV